jgi:5'-methylthioadenosine phosphorylase
VPDLPVRLHRVRRAPGGRAVLHRRAADRVPRRAAARCARCSARSASSSRAPASTRPTAAPRPRAARLRADSADASADLGGATSTAGPGGRSATTEAGRQPAATPRGEQERLTRLWTAATRRRRTRPRVGSLTGRGSRHVHTIGVIGGSGLYALLDDARTVEVETPYGPPSDPLVVGEVGGGRSSSCRGTAATTASRRTASPTAPTCGRCAASGVRQVLAPVRGRRACARARARARWSCPDQLVDRTSGRRRPSTRPARCTCRSPTPYCPTGAPRVALAGEAGGRRPTADDGRVEGPALLHARRVAVVRRAGLVGRQHDRPPRGVLARELALCSPASPWSPTSTPAWRAARRSPRPSLRVFAENTDRLRSCCSRSLPAPPSGDCACGGPA